MRSHTITRQSDELWQTNEKAASKRKSPQKTKLDESCPPIQLPKLELNTNRSNSSDSHHRPAGSFPAQSCSTVLYRSRLHWRFESNKRRVTDWNFQTETFGRNRFPSKSGSLWLLGRFWPRTAWLVQRCFRWLNFPLQTMRRNGLCRQWRIMNIINYGLSLSSNLSPSNGLQSSAMKILCIDAIKWHCFLSSQLLVKIFVCFKASIFNYHFASF